MGSQLKLSTLCSIRSGYPFRGRIEHDANGIVRVIQMRDFDYRNMTISNNLTRVKEERGMEKHFLKSGDVILVAKGFNNFAIEVGPRETQTLASGSFVILRIEDTQRILPGYLEWYLN